jgi:thioredoxin reductase (NADPH)
MNHSIDPSVEHEADGKLRVFWQVNGVTNKDELFDSVLFATGRRACTDALNLDAVGLVADKQSGKIVCPCNETTSISNIHVIGDARAGNPELTPVAIRQ